MISIGTSPYREFLSPGPINPTSTSAVVFPSESRKSNGNIFGIQLHPGGRVSGISSFPTPPGTFHPHNQNFFFSLVRAPKFALNFREGFALVTECGRGEEEARVTVFLGRSTDAMPVWFGD